MIDRILSLFFLKKCPYCRQIISSGLAECEDCRREFPETPKQTTLLSGISCIAPFSYHAKVRDSIILYKFKSVTFNAESYAKAICRTILFFHMQDSFDMITYVPLTNKRKRERGFNQSELVARKVAAYFHKECTPLLKKVRQNKNQHDLGAKERKTNILGVFDVCSKEKIVGKHILLFDDVATTGYTMAECSRLLYENGAENVQCIAIAIAGGNI